MSTATYPPLLPRKGTAKFQRNGLVLTLALFLGLPLAALTFYMFVEGSSEKAAFYVYVSWFLLFGISYLEVFGVRSRLGYGGPAVITYLALLELGLVPIWRVSTGADIVDGDYVRAMFLVAAGFTMFWIGSWVTLRKITLSFVPLHPLTVERTTFMGALFLVIGVGTNAFLWKAGLLSYLAEASDRDAAAPYLQWVGIGQRMLLASMVISGIEVLGKKSRTVLVVLTFWASVVFALSFGLISGMKSEILMPLVLLVLILATTRQRLPRAALVLPLLLVMIYPFVTSYREALNSGSRNQAKSVSGVTGLMSDAFENAFSSTPEGQQGALGQGLSSTSERLSLLSSVRFIVGMPSPSLLNGEEKLWMAPFYPLVPRFLWHNKPVLNKGQRFSVAIGLPPTTSTAISAVGDFYIYGRTAGVFSGMLAYGIGLQLIMNWIGGRFSEKGLYFYLSFLPTIANLENDVVSMIAGIVSNTIIYLLLSNVVYGGGIFTFHAPKQKADVQG